MATRHSDEVLQGMVLHIIYEVGRMRLIGPMLLPDSWPQIVHESMLEAYLLHARNVDTFLRGIPNPHPGDILASDYFDEGDWTTQAIELEVREALNRRIAHISTDRLIGSDGTPGAPFDWSDENGSRAWLGDSLFEGYERWLHDLADSHPERARWFGFGSLE